MKALKWIVLGAAVLLSTAACYWAPPGGGLTLTLQGKDMPQSYYGYAIRVELFKPEDISATVDKYFGEITIGHQGEPLPINGQPYFEVGTGESGAEGWPAQPEIVIPDIPEGVYRLRVGLWYWYGEGGDPDLRVGVSEPFSVSAGGTANVDVSLYYLMSGSA